jgi:uncharacterized protein YbjT (DUF2867 family)
MARIVVTTATGRVGSHVVRLLVQAGQRPVLLVRDARRLDRGIRDHADVVEGDQFEVDDVLRATEGADALYWVAPSDGDDPTEGYARLGAIAARAVVENGIGHTVFQSSVGAELRSGVGEIDGLARAEEALDATGAAVLHLRCGYFFTNLAMDAAAIESGELTATLPVDATLPWVDPRDIGDVAAARLLARDWQGTLTQGVHGPADLSFADVAGILGRVLGRPVRAVYVEPDELRASLVGFGMTDAQADGIVGMATGLRDLVPENPRDAVTTTPTTLASWAVANLA